MSVDITELVGPLMKSCRLADGIEAPAVMEALGYHDTDELARFESDPTPPPSAVEAYARACRQNYDRAKALIARSAAAREQYYGSHLDGMLTNHVQLSGRPVRWWWADRAGAGGRAPMCYICDEDMTPRRTDLVLGEADRRAVMKHRQDHLNVLAVTGEIHRLIVGSDD